MAHHIFVQGPLGAGKTFLMSVLAHHWRQKVIRDGGYVEIYSNYGLSDSKPIDHYTDWYEVAKSQGSIVCWDEAHMAFDNRRWSRYGQGVATDVMMYTRKMRSVQMYCSPTINNVDSRIRQIIEVLIDVRKIADKGFSVRFNDYQAKQYMHTQFIPMSLAKKYFKKQLYDTYQMVQGFPLPSTEREGNEFFRRLEELHDAARFARLQSGTL